MTKRHARDEFFDCFYGDDVSDENSDSDLDAIVHTVAIRRGVVLLATCRSQAVIIKAFIASPAFDTVMKRSKRRMEL